jgi:predicted MFS family arabinose efflux permease
MLSGGRPATPSLNVPIHLMATVAGFAVANIYYNQPMLADIARTFEAAPHHAGLVATFTQIGYALGMPLFVPLADFTERRRLVTLLFLAAAVSLALAAAAPTLAWLVLASLLIGITSVIAQILLPFAAEIAPPHKQGRTVGAILSGILLGILLARALSGFVAGRFGWRAMFWLGAVISLAACAAVRARLPQLPPRPTATYGELMRSLATLFRELPALRQASTIAALFFAAFSAFWTTLVFRLEAPPYHYGSEAAGLFGLVGAVGAVIAPVAGRLVDRRTPRFVVALAIGVVLLSFVIFAVAGAWLWGLVAGVILLDAGIQAAQVANQSSVLSLRPDARGRINTIYMLFYFGGASIGSLIGSWAWSRWNWPGVCVAGMALMALAAAVLFRRDAHR